MNKFEVVSKYIKEDGTTDIKVPVRATAHSAGYDFAAAKDTVVLSMWQMMDEAKDWTAKNIAYNLKDFKEIAKATGIKPTLIPTGIKCNLDDDKYLELSVRSSTPLNNWITLANGVGKQL